MWPEGSLGRHVMMHLPTGPAFNAAGVAVAAAVPAAATAMKEGTCE